MNVASIGIGMMGNGNIRRMLSNPDLQLVAVCDVDEWRLNDARGTVETAYAAETKRGNYKGVTANKDFREILARPDIDAVLIATGDRWHAVISTMAAKAGKDVYCEKPVSLTIHESRVMVDTFRRYNRIFQGGYQQRSVDDFAAARRLIQNGRIGTLKTIYCNWYGTSKVLNLPAETRRPGSTGICGSARRPTIPSTAATTQSVNGVRELCRGTSSAISRAAASRPMASHHLDIAQWVMGMDDSGPVEIVPGTPERRIIDFKYANGVLVQSFQGQLESEVPGDSGGLRSHDALPVGDTVRRRPRMDRRRPSGPAEGVQPGDPGGRETDATRAAAARREDRCHLAAGPGRADLSGARLRAPRQLDSSDSAPLAADVECGGRDAINERRAPREHRHLDGPHAEVGSDQGRVHRRRHGQSDAPEGDAGAVDGVTAQQVRGFRLHFSRTGWSLE